MPTANVFKPYVAGVKSDLETRLHQDLLRRFNGIEPQERPWYGAGLTLQVGSITKSLNFVIVPPTHVILAHVFGLPDAAAGTVHGSQTAKEWWLETADARVLKIGGDVSPFEQAKATLHLLLPKLDSFLHSRKVRNPYVHSILIFPDDYNFTGVQDIPVGPTARGAVTIVKLSEVWQAALSHTQARKLDPAVFAAWLKTLLPNGVESSFSYTWIDPSPAPDPEPSERTAALDASLTAPFSQDDNEVITLSQEAEWSLGERSEEFILPQKDDITPSAKREHHLNRTTIVSRLLKFTAGGVLVLLILFIGHEVYMYLTPRFPSTPYWQGTTAAEPDQSPSADLQSGAQNQQQDISEPTPPSTATPNAPNPPPRTADATPAPQPKAETQVANQPAPSAARADGIAQITAPVRPAVAGTYETIRATVAFDQPRDSGPVIDQIRTGTKLNVIGAEGDWLIVRSRTRNTTVYIRRDDAMLTSDPGTQPRSMERIEQRWKEIELQIGEAILRQGVPNVSVSFIGDTAYLRGNVRTPDDSHKAELAAKTIPDVKYVHNGIWVKR